MSRDKTINRPDTVVVRPGHRDAAGISRHTAVSARAGSLDLNLLVYFEALFTEGQVSRAAERVNLSQPAMSLALKRLREMFDDPLLVRTPHGMVPTARARELIGPVRKMLRQSRELLGPRKGFDPAEVAGPFLLVATDYVAALVLPGVLRRFQTEAPLAQVVVRTANPFQLKRWFEDGKVELGLGYTELPPQELRMRHLFEERVVCIVRKDHPKIRGSVSVEQLRAASHVEVHSMRKPRYAVALEQALSTPGVEPHIGLVVSDFRIAPEVVATTDMIAVVPERLAKANAAEKRLQVLQVPVELPKMTFSMVWHERTHREPVYQWLRDVVAEVCLSDV